MDDKKPIVFVITPFTEECLDLYAELKRVFENEYEFTNAGDLDNQRNILQDIVSGIHLADIIIADLSGLNANVFYELGLAHAMNKKVIIITQDISDLPFDIQSYRANEYSLQFNKFPKLIDKLRELLAGAIDESIHYGNPVVDYLPDFFTNNVYPNQGENKDKTDDVETNQQTESEESEAGFLDYISSIDEYSKKMVVEINGISDELHEMTSSLNEATLDINRVKTQSGSADVSFVRNICRKLSEPVDSFAQKLRGHTEAITEYWSIVENCFLSLIDNKFMQSGENKKVILKNIKDLLDTKNAIIDSNAKIIGFTNVLKGSVGIERKLNKAITTLIFELEKYLSTTMMMSSSIDRIQAKSKVTLENTNN